MENKWIKISIGFNALLILVIGFMLIFSKPTDVNEYKAEISRLETLNELILIDNERLINDTKESEDRVKNLELLLSAEITKSKIYKDEFRRIEKSRETVRDGVRALPHDSVSVELTKYLGRRNTQR